MRWTPILAVPFLELFSYSLVDQYPGVQGYNPPFHNHPPKPSSSEAAKEAFWLRQLLICGLKQDVSLPTPLFIDNRGSQLLAKNPVTTTTRSILMSGITSFANASLMDPSRSGPLPPRIMLLISAPNL